MATTLTYATFLALFVLAPMVLVRRGRRERRRLAGVATGLMVGAALAYTIPWDNYLIAEGVWWYGDGTVAFRIWNAPVEEYLFIGLQPILAALWLYGRGWSGPADTTGTSRHPTDTDAGPVTPDGGTPTALATTAPSAPTATSPRLLGTVAWLAVAAVGLWALLSGWGYYLGAILAWAGPVLALQWAVGGGYLWAIRRRLGGLVAVPTLYLWAIDWLAIELGIWTISPDYTVGVAPFGLPVEEMTFFVVTNLLVVQGIVLFHRVIERWR